jgi:hypothetical protein
LDVADGILKLQVIVAKEDTIIHVDHANDVITEENTVIYLGRCESYGHEVYLVWCKPGWPKNSSTA